MSNTNINCPKCGASLNGDSLYCNYCGAAITDVRDLLKKKAEINLQREEIDENIRLEKQKRRSTLWETLPILIFGVIGLGVILFMCLMATRH